MCYNQRRGAWHTRHMVILTTDELLLMPTGTALVASLAPAEMRGRYMGLYNLTWSVAYGLGPALGGVLNDQIAPAATWYGGMAAALVAMVGFVPMASRLPNGLEPQITRPGHGQG
ncbi:MAG TPA: MFS transporter [Anaerolineae bacterium]|nr:MFS transporter [Anaerolineae bacterium]